MVSLSMAIQQNYIIQDHSNQLYQLSQLTTTIIMDIQSQDSIQVVVRVKPNPLGSFLSYSDANILLGKTNFAFDKIFMPNASQYDIYKFTGCKQIQHTLEGYNSCLFVYGQTGSGKTHTMIGNNNGIIQQSLHHLFNRMSQNLSNEYKVTCSYFEIYNEQLFDLLDPNKQKKMNVRQDIKKGVFIEGLVEEEILIAERGISLLNQGVRTRHVGETLMNRQSSRSHAIFSLNVQSKLIQNGNSIMKKSKIHFVDLAGSERQKSTAAVGERLKQASNINKSLTTLGMVINCLSGDKSKSHVPFRDSKLTFVLRDSLSGNSKTFLIATVADSQNSIQQTLSTLKFAQRAKMVKLSASINEESLSLNVQVLKSEIIRLKDELARVNKQLIEQKNKKPTSAPYNEVIVTSYSRSMDELNDKINSLVQMIPKLIDKSSEPEESNVEQYIKNNNQMLSSINDSLSKFISLKNEVRAKASLQKLRMEDITPYKCSLGKLNIKRVSQEDKNQNQAIARLELQKKQNEEKVLILLDQQREMKDSMDKIIEAKNEEYKILEQKNRMNQNKTFELQQNNSNLAVQLQILRQKLKNSEEKAGSEEKMITEYEHKLTSSGLYIESLSRQMSELHNNITDSAKKHRRQLDLFKQDLQQKEKELIQQQSRYQKDVQSWRQQRSQIQKQKLEIEDQSIGLMKRLDEEMRKSDQVEAKNIQLQKQNAIQCQTITEITKKMQQRLLREKQLKQNYQRKENEILYVITQKDEQIQTLKQQLSASNKNVQNIVSNNKSLVLEIEQKNKAVLECQNQIQALNCALLKEVQSRQALTKQLEDSKMKSSSQLQQLKTTYSSQISQLKQSTKLKQKCNQLTVENYKLRNYNRVPLDQVDNTQISMKLDYYEQKFNLMKIQYNKSIETIRSLKQREILIKEENMKLNNSIRQLELELQITPHGPLSSENKNKPKKLQKDNKQNDKKEKNFGDHPSNNQVSELLRGLINKLEVDTTHTSTGQGFTIAQLITTLEETLKKKENRFKKQMQKESRIKSQNHLVVKQNLYLKERIKALQDGNQPALTPSKKIKIN